ncbi:hypothetical protein [Paraburkholderia saeva]|uniref:GlsB/YeaQ/YmgE family stress response membrane protein n=1 Tax=Paraburkholderia saeva TaxID=2777537 RepID=A0A9N8X3W5_9BURK|nr:hypothetical protein [Paraburkholderia saeva]CAG4918885.1 hypothetical protein LMG31841_04822 [Paraburkholderia saeva]
MGWAGIAILGAVVGLVGGWLHPLRRAGRGRIVVALVAGIVGAVVAAMAGNVTGLFHDGDTLEWLACTSVALIAVAVTVGLLSRR